MNTQGLVEENQPPPHPSMYPVILPEQKTSDAFTWQSLRSAAVSAFQEGLGVGTHHHFQSLFSIPFP